MVLRVAVVGASGYVGGELIRLLSQHPDVELGALTAHGNAGRPIASVHHHMHALADRVFTATDVEEVRGHDVIFLALPHGEAGSFAAHLQQELSPTAVLVDCGADHRLRNEADWLTWYGGPYAGSWPYGMPELLGGRASLRGARRIAVPGCYPTAASLAFAPLMAAGLAKPEVSVVAASGTSGAGRSTKADLTSAEVMGAMSAYGVGGSHRHTPEMIQNLSAAAGSAVRVSFTPLLAPMPRGILATVSAPATATASAAAVRAAVEQAYADEPFVRFLPEGTWPTTAGCVGSNTVLVQAAFDERADRVIAIAALDNLTKGAAGQAVQCMNLAVGLPETRGLPTVGIAP